MYKTLQDFQPLMHELKVFAQDIEILFVFILPLQWNILNYTYMYF